MRATHIFYLTLFALFTPMLAHADGFICQGNQSGLHIQVYNYTEAGMGTRNPAVLVIADATQAQNNQTIATFSGQDQSLSYQGYGVYLAVVGANQVNSYANANKNIVGVKLGQLGTITLSIDFSYTKNGTSIAKSGIPIPGKIAYAERTGGVLGETVSCSRYLKN